MYNHNKAQQSKNRVHISWDILYKQLFLTVFALDTTLEIFYYHYLNIAIIALFMKWLFWNHFTTYFTVFTMYDHCYDEYDMFITCIACFFRNDEIKMFN